MNVALRAAPFLALPLLMIAGCGTPAAPQPPSLKLPEPVTNLAVIRAGDEVRLTWTMPKRTTDKIILIGDQAAHICRRVEAAPCETAGDAQFAPNASAAFVDHLPASLTSGPPRLLTYVVELRNHAGHTAGPSNQAYTAAGAAPIQPVHLSAKAQPEGVLLQWTPVDGTKLLRIHRILVSAPKKQKPAPAKQAPAKGAPAKQAPKEQSPDEQILEVTGNDQGQALDRDAALDQTYRYTAERVARLSLAQHPLEVLSQPSDTVTIDAKDVFPPHTPEALQAVADPDARAIDLSWAPDTESDVAGYIVYRRDTASGDAATRISPSRPAPSFRDLNVSAGHRYAYSVSAIDRDGNESARSPEIEETLPKP